MKRVLPILVLLLFPLAIRPQNTSPSWDDWHFLLGEWTAGESNGVPGSASKGSFTLTPDLGGQVLVRKNHAEYPPVYGRPAIVHDDLMIIYHVPSGSGRFVTKAFYDDSEGHVIQYDVSFSPDKKRIVFLSAANQGAPQYRLTYENVEPGTAKVLFEIAPADKPGEFNTYVQATVNRK